MRAMIQNNTNFKLTEILIEKNTKQRIDQVIKCAFNYKMLEI